MLDFLLKLKNSKNSINEFCSSVHQGIPSVAFGVGGSFKNFLVSQIDLPILYIVKDSLTAEKSVKEIGEFSNKKAIYIPPRDLNLLVIKAFSKDAFFERIKAIEEIKSADIVVATPETILQGFSKDIRAISLEKGKDFDVYNLTKIFVQLGYERVETIEGKGAFSIRGDVVEIFPINSPSAVRLDFFGDTLESIREFNPENRENLGYKDTIKILQATEFSFSNDTYEDIEKAFDEELKNLADKQKHVKLTEVKNQVLSAFESKDRDTLSCFSYLSRDNVSIFSLLRENAIVCYDEAKSIDQTFQIYEKEFIDRFESLYSSGELLKKAKNSLFSYEETLLNLKSRLQIAVQTLSTSIPFFNPLKIVNPQISGVANYHLDFKEVYADINNWAYSNYTVIVFTGTEKRAIDFNFELSKTGVASTLVKPSKMQGVMISDQKLSSGFIFHEEKLVVIGSGNLYARQTQVKRYKSKKQGFFTAPETGDYCVHETHGIGKVLGVKKISTLESTKDYVAVLYAGGDILYVPVEQMDLLTRYLGAEKNPKLSRIGGVDFERVKKSVRESIKKMSFDLKKLYNERKNAEGYRFFSDEELEKAFADQFPFEETLDQLTAEKDIKEDMESPAVMDRLICGDVGFGKTEIAFRAIFRAILNGKQSVLLAPTTILTEQHYNTAIKRFENFGVNIACLNRFRRPKEQEKILEDLKSGKIDLIIGTHRLLSKDVEFKDLGLLVLDEEQRFGVEHKEKIKLLKKNVDTLTLTATPIPRTLHMSLSGIRSISTINTPPKKRLPVQTYVVEETDSLIKDAVVREINRGGQVFILYNRVESIFTFAERVRGLLPNVKMTVVHGQMDERTMEKNINEFYKGETSLLISTTIIENGIDLPKANTIIVIDADRLGLSTLYQLKGRVGRSNRLAYAYFTFKREKILSDTAYERLNAIIEFTEMGSGIKIAMRDLEIRGAGNILGAEQHGHMDRIGYELYSKLLREELSETEEKVPELDIRITAFIPEKYIESNTSRMECYKEIAEIDSLDAEEEFISTVESNYGKLPKEVFALVNIAVTKYLAMKLGVEKIVISKDERKLILSDLSALKDGAILKAVKESSGDASISVSSKISIDFLSQGEDSVEILLKMRIFLENALNYKKNT